jgi:hypothetical protein
MAAKSSPDDIFRAIAGIYRKAALVLIIAPENLEDGGFS